MRTGDVYAFCVDCGCVAVHDDRPERHFWIERAADAEERRTLAGIVCNVCGPRPDLICEGCGKIGNDPGSGYVWRERTPTRRELMRLRRHRCPDCRGEGAAAHAP